MNNVRDQEKIYLGLMSGTSCDGLDITGLKIHVESEVTCCELQFFAHYPYTTELKNRLLQLAISPSFDLQALAQLEIELMHLYAERIKQTLAKNKFLAKQITAIGLHGQTIRHHPNNPYPSTWQLGEPAALAARTNIDVISHFRQSDIAHGGQGAPLAPIFHQQLLQQSSMKKNRRALNELIVNLGGIANLSCFYADGHALAFDTGPANTLLDCWVREQNLNQQGFDPGGKLASQGKIQVELLEKLLAEPYFSQPPPKSTGREVFNVDWLKQKINRMNKVFKPVDILATLTALTVKSIIASIPDQGELMWDTLWLCGGGTENDFLIQLMASELTKKYPNIHIDRLEKKVNMPSQSIEAGAWAWLAYLYQQDTVVDLQYITGATHQSVLGRLSKY